MARTEVGQRSETVRRANLSAIVRELHLNGAASRSDLVARTGLTRSAIRGLIAELVAAGFVSEEAPAPSGSPGRPSPVVCPAPDRAVVIGIEIAVDSLAVVLAGLGGTVLERRRIERARGHITVDEIVHDLALLLSEVLARRPDVVPLGAAAGVVGVVRRTDGFVSMAPNLGWRDVPLGERLAAAIDLPVPIALANEADLGALAESRRGAAVGVDDVLFLSGEVGVGGGIIVQGKPLTGAAGYAGEVGHMPVNPDGVQCGCGAIGCWETEVGAHALLERSGRSRDAGPEAVEEVLRDAERGDPVALAGLETVGRWTGVGLAALVNTLNPRLIVLGGLLGRAFPYIHAAIESELERRALRAPASLVQVVPGRLGEDGPLLGAAELAFEPVLADPAAWFARRTGPARANAA